MRLLPAGWLFALPSEAQWEYACRAGTTVDFAGDLEDMAWYDSNSSSGPHAVATKKANAWGLYDMHGNVCEWCADWYGDYPRGTLTDPAGPIKGSARVLRGGSWFHDGRHCGSVSRSRFTPDTRNDYLGFRVTAVTSGS